MSALAHGSRRDEGDLIAGRGRGVPRAWLGLIVVALVLGALAAAASVLERGDGSPVASSRARSAPATARLGLASLPAAAQGPVSAALGRDDPAYRVRARAGALRAANPAQHLRATFARDGVLVADGAARVGLSLLTRGSGHSLQRLPAAAPALTGGRVEYRHGPVSEWWTNGPLGLEQTFEESAPTATEPVTLALAVSGNMHARLANGAVLLHRAGVSLRYAGLRATDARGKRLPAWLSLNGRTILIKVDARGARYPVRIDPFVQDAELSEASGANGDSFGTSVAIDGDTAVVGAPLYGTGGAAFVFVEGTSGWPATPTATLTYPGTRQGDGFGSAVAISGTVGSDGKLTDGRIVVGAPFAGSDTGAAYLFDEPQSQTWVNNGNNYVILQPPSNGVPINPQKPTPEFGAAVATAGTTAFVGMAGEELINVYTVPFPSYGGEVAGAEITGGGVGLAVSPDGTTLAAGYPNGPSGADPGLVNVYTEPQGGWSTVDLSTPAAATLQNVTDGSYDKTDNDLFGASVAVSDANVVVVGAPNAPEPGTSPGPGAAYIFTPSTGSWATDNGATESQVATLTAGSGLANDQLGASVGISSNGDTVVVGAPGVDNTSPTTTGHVYDFTKQGTTWTSLSNPDEPTVPTGARLGDMFGSSVGITGDGTSILAGDENSGGPGVIAGEGSAYVFESPVPHNTSLPTITVDGPEPNPGVKLGCNAGAWSNGPISGYTYQWNRNGAPISGETNALYTIQPGDVGVPLTCTVTASNTSGAGPAATSNSLTPVAQGMTTTSTTTTGAPPPPPPPTVTFTISPDTDPLLSRQTITFSVVDPVPYATYFWDFGDMDQTPGSASSPFNAQTVGDTVTYAYPDPPIVQTGANSSFPCPPALPTPNAGARDHASAPSCPAPTSRSAVYVVRVQAIVPGYPPVTSQPQNVVVTPVQPPNSSFMVLRSSAGAGSGQSTDANTPVTIVPQGALASTESSAQDSIVREDFWLGGSSTSGPPDITCLSNGMCGQYTGSELIPPPGSLASPSWLSGLGTGALYSDGTPSNPRFHCLRDCPASFVPTDGFESFSVNFWARALAEMGTPQEPQVPTAPATGDVKTSSVGYPTLGNAPLSEADGNLGEQGFEPSGTCIAGSGTTTPCGIVPGSVNAQGVFPAQIPNDLEQKSPNPLYLAEDKWNFLYNYATAVGPDSVLDDPFGPVTAATQGRGGTTIPRQITMVAYDAEGVPSAPVSEPVTLTPPTNPTVGACISDLTANSPCVSTSKFNGAVTPIQIIAGDDLQLQVGGSSGGEDPLLYYAAELGRPNTDPIGNLVIGGRIDPSKPAGAQVAPCPGSVGSDVRDAVVSIHGGALAVPNFADLLGGAAWPYHPCQAYAERTVNANGQPDPLPPSGPVHVASAGGQRRRGRNPDLPGVDQVAVTTNPNSVFVQIPATNPQPWPDGGDSGGIFSLALAEYNTAGLGAITRTDGLLALPPGPSGFCQQVNSWPFPLPGQKQEVGFSGGCMATDGSHWFATSSTMDIDGMPLAPPKGDFIVINPDASNPTNAFYVTDSCNISQGDLTQHTVPSGCGPHGSNRLYLALGTSADGPGMAYMSDVTGDTAAALFSPASAPAGTDPQGCGLFAGSQPWTLASKPQYDGFDVKSAPCISFSQEPNFTSRADFNDSLPGSFAPVNAMGAPSAPPATSPVHLAGVDQPPVTNLTTTPYASVARHHPRERVIAGSGIRLAPDPASYSTVGIPDPPSCPAEDNSKLSIPPDTNLGPWQLPGNAEMCYDSSTGDFIGDATINIPLPIPITGIKIGFEIGQGRLIEAGGDVTGALPIGPVLLQELKFDIKTDPVLVAAEIKATIAPLLGLDMSGVYDGDSCSPPTCPAATATPSFDLNGAVSIAGFNFANFNIHFGPNIWTMATDISASFGPASINVSVEGGIYTGTPFQFYLEGNGSACLFVCLGVSGLISNDALAGCGSINLVVATISAGFAVVWSGPNSGVQVFTGCDLTPYIPAVFRGGAIDPQPAPAGGLWAAHAGDTGPPLALNAGQSAGLQLCPAGSPPGCATDVVAVQLHSLVSQEAVGESPQVTLTGPDGRTITTPCTPGYYGFVGSATPSGCLQNDSQTDEGTAMVDENPVPIIDQVPGSPAGCAGVNASTTFATLPPSCAKVTTTTIFVANPGTGSWTLSVPAGAPNVVDTTVATTDGPTTPGAFNGTVTKTTVKPAGDGFVADIDHHEYPSSMLNVPDKMMLAPSADVPVVASAARTKHGKHKKHKKHKKAKPKPPTIDVPVIDQSRLRAILLKVPAGFQGNATVIDTSSAGQQVLANHIDAAEIPKGGLPIVFEPDVASGPQQIQAFLSNEDNFPSGVLTLSSFTPPAPPAPQAPKIVRVVRDGATLHIYFKPGNAPIANGVSLTVSVGNGQQIDETFLPAQLRAIGKLTGIGAAKQAAEYEATVTRVEPTEPVSLAMHGSNDGHAGKVGRRRGIKPAMKSIGAKKLLKMEVKKLKQRHRGHKRGKKHRRKKRKR